MKVTRQEEYHSSRESRHESVISAWRTLERTSAGADELVSIQRLIGDETVSPAEIARELAKEGIELRHPEVIVCDARWRETHFEKQAARFAGVVALRGAALLELKEAEAAIAEMERLRDGFAAQDDLALHELKALAVDARETANRRAHDAALSQSAQKVQAEIAEWVRVWLETPNLFAQWLELRKASATFIANFPED